MFVPTQRPIFTPGPDIRWCNHIAYVVSSAVWKECPNAPLSTKPRAQSKIFTQVDLVYGVFCVISFY